LIISPEYKEKEYDHRAHANKGCFDLLAGMIEKNGHKTENIERGELQHSPEIK
jgi:hypothetical protein